MDFAQLEETLAARGEPGYRAKQVWQWAARGAVGYDAMTNVPAGLRQALEEDVPFSTLEVETEARSKDGTVKALFSTHDRHPVEAVLMTYRDGRRSLCLSSQSGCPLTCTFCATGQMRFRRNLTAAEIVDQALHFRRQGPISHVVFMGMGEPMLNLDHVLDAAALLPDLGITPRRTTISTVGWLPGLTRFVDDVKEPIRLALSLHAPDDALRSQLMPVNDRYPLADVLAECRRYASLAPAEGLRGVRDAGRRQRPRRAGAAAGGAARAAPLQGQSHSVQPDGCLRRLVAESNRRIQVRARPRADCPRPSASRAAATSTPRAGSWQRRRIAA